MRQKISVSRTEQDLEHGFGKFVKNLRDTSIFKLLVKWPPPPATPRLRKTRKNNAMENGQARGSIPRVSLEPVDLALVSFLVLLVYLVFVGFQSSLRRGIACGSGLMPRPVAWSHFIANTTNAT